MKTTVKKSLEGKLYLILPIGITLVMMLLKSVYFGEPDDVFMMNIANSHSFNSHSEHLVFIGVIVGYAVRFLYRIIPAINWFSIAYLFAIDLSFVLIFKVFFRRIEKYTFKNVFILILISGMLIFNLGNLTFTGVAYFLCAAAVIWYYANVEKLDRQSVKHIILCLALFILGYSFRGGSLFYSVLLFLVPSAIAYVMKDRRRLLAGILLVAVCVASSYAVTGVQNYYNKATGIEKYVEFNDIRSAATDEGGINYEEFRDELSAVGITQNDINLYSSYMYADSEVFSADNIRVISESKNTSDKYTVSLSSLADSLLYTSKEAPTIVNYHLIRFLFYFIIVGLAVFITYKKLRLDVFLIAGFTMASEFYLFFRKRAVARVVNPIAEIGILLVFFFVLYYAGRSDLGKTEVKKKLILLMVPVMMVSGMLGLYVNNAQKRETQSDIISYVQNDKEDNVYVTTPVTGHAFLNWHLSFLSHNDAKQIYNLCGDWHLYSPYWYALMDEIGLSEYSEKGLLTPLDDNVMFVCDTEAFIPMLTEYYKEHYNIDAEFTVVNDFENNVKIYKVTAKN